MLRRFLLSSALTLLAVLAGGLDSTRAQDGGRPATKRGRIPVRIIGGKLIARCDASTVAGRIPVNLLVELESQGALQIHRQAAGPGALDLGSMEVQADYGLVTLHFPGFEVSTTEVARGPERQWENFTRLHSEDLGEVSVVGAIGARIFDPYHLTIDLNEGFLHVDAPHAGGEPMPRAERNEIVTPITVTNRVAWLPVRVDGARPVAAGIGTRFYDTIVDKALCASLGKPAGDVGAVTLGDVNLAEYVAFRPGELKVETDDDAGFLIGLNVLEHFRVEIDRVNRWARLTPTVPPTFPADDLVYFRALVTGEAGPLESFLDEHANARLAAEAAEQLLKLRMDHEGSSDAALSKALRWTLDTRPEDLRATIALELATDLHEKGRDDVAVAAAEQGIEAGKKDRDPNAIHHLHGLIGEVLLARGEGQAAWRHLLSAAFGVPEDGRVNLSLGRYYEQEGRLRRAFSRYVQASIKAEGGADAMLGLARVQRALGGDSLGVDEIERLVEGKIQTFTSATKFEPTPETTTNRTPLVEFFTTPNLEQVGLAGELAFESSLTFYPRSSAVMLTYHLPGETPTATPVATHHASFYGVGNPGVNVIDGFRTVDGAGRMRDREKMMQELRDAIGDELLSETEYTMTMEAALADGHVTGKVRVEGPAHPDLMIHVILVERGVVFPGKSNIVIHRMLARGALTESLAGAPYRPDASGAMELLFERSLTDITAEIEAYLAQLEAAGSEPIPRVSTRIDPAQVAVVAFVRNERSTVVQQSTFVDPNATDETEDAE